MELLKNLIHYLPYILLFAVATMLIYGWGLWRSMHQNQDLNNLLTSKGISRIKKESKSVFGFATALYGTTGNDKQN